MCLRLSSSYSLQLLLILSLFHQFLFLLFSLYFFFFPPCSASFLIDHCDHPHTPIRLPPFFPASLFSFTFISARIATFNSLCLMALLILALPSPSNQLVLSLPALFLSFPLPLIASSPSPFLLYPVLPDSFSFLLSFISYFLML